MKKIIRLIVALSLIAFFIFIPSFIKCKASPITYRTLNMKVGQKKQIKLKNIKYKLKWTSSDKKTATVTKNGTIKAKYPGSCYIEGKNIAHNKTVIYSVNIDINNKKAKKNITTQTDLSGSKCGCAYVCNKNNFGLTLTYKAIYYDENNTLLDEYSTDITIPANDMRILKLPYPTDNEYNRVKPSYIKDYVNILYEHITPDYSEKIDTKYTLTPSKCIIKARNKSKKKISFIRYTCIFYDENDCILDIAEDYLDCYNPNDISISTIDLPYNDNYEIITPSTVDIYINFAQ